MPRPQTPFLVEFHAGDAGETHSTIEIRLTNGQVRRYATTNITINGDVYTDDLIKCSGIEESEETTTDKMTAVLQNVTNAIGLEIKSGAFQLAEATIGRVFRRADGVFEWEELFFGQVIPRPRNYVEAQIEIIDDLVAAGDCISNWTLSAICQLTHRSPECGSTAPGSCNKLLKGNCTEYGRTHRNVSETFPEPKNDVAPVEISPGFGVVVNEAYGYDPYQRWKQAYDNPYADFANISN